VVVAVVVVVVVVAYKSLLRKDLTRSYRADPAVRRPHECAQSPVAELRML
jgi:NADH:ubiquinone oxidoreductase subunit 3 (subunit A)